MLTRALLLLLAMMTGLSAAEAAGSARPARDAAAVSNAVDQMVQDNADRCASHTVRRPILAGWNKSTAEPKTAPKPAPSTPGCTYHSDRPRE